MSAQKIIHLAIDGAMHAYPMGMTYREIAAELQDRYDCDILLVKEGERLRELHRAPAKDCAVELLTARDKQGFRTYERSVTFLLLRAFYAVVGQENIDRISVEFSLSNALFLTAEGKFALTAELLAEVEQKMREMVEQDLPIEKKTLPVDDAIELFREENMADKADLLRFRVSSTVNVYTLDGFTDYFYGFMAQSTGYLKVFAVEPFEEGFVLRLPAPENPNVLGEFRPPMKVFREMYETTLLSRKAGISNVAEMNRSIVAGGIVPMILSSEALMEKKIGDIAEEIASRSGVRFVMIAGPSSSGKTTFSHRLSTQLRARGLRPYPIATDNYFVNRDQTPRDEKGEYDFECLGAMDVEQFNRDMTALLRGESIELPTYNFKKGVREYNGQTLQLGEQDVLVIEGIHCLNDEFSYSLPAESKYRIYISCLTTLNIDNHNRIPTTDARLLRRMVRDARTRGHGARATIKMWPNVRKGEEDNIFPHQDSADVVMNSAMLYETALLRTYAEPILFDIPHDCPEYVEANRLLKFLSYFMPVPAEAVPATSIAREFAGGGCYDI